MSWCAKWRVLASYSVFVLVVVLLSTEHTKAKQDLGHGTSSESKECSINPHKRARIYDEANHVWTITDKLLRQLDNDLQRIIDCTKEDDILYFKTTQTITPNAAMIIPWNLTITADPKPSTTTARDVDSKEEYLPVSFTCPRIGGVIISESRWLTISNVQFIECSNSGTIISVEPVCRGAEEDGQIQIHNVEFVDNALYSNQRILDVRYPYCTGLSLDNVVIHNNKCDAQDCIALPSTSTLRNISVTQNSGHESCLSSQAVFFLPIQSHAFVTGVEASRNEIRIFGMEAYATLKLVQSNFHDNNPVLSPIFHEAVGGGVLYVKDSTASIERCTFDSNSAPNGGVLFSIHSRVNISECSFIENQAKDSLGGALFINSSTLNVSQSTFESNKAQDNAAVLFAELSVVTIQLTNITRSYSEFSGTVFLLNCTADLDGVIFGENVAQWFGGALDASGSDIKIESTSFVSNNGSSGSAVSLRYQTNATISRSSFSRNNARYFGALHTNEGSKVEIEECNFEQNTANAGGAIYLVTGAKVKINGSIIYYNRARYKGGGVFARFGAKFISSLTIFTGNRAEAGDGGGIFSESSDVFLYSSIVDFSTGKSGGGVHVTDASIRIYKCNITSSHAAENGAGIYCGNSIVHLRESFLNRNYASIDGGGIYATKGTRLLGKESMVFGNSAVEKGGGIALMDRSVYKCSTCKVMDNSAKIGPDIFEEPSLSTT